MTEFQLTAPPPPLQPTVHLGPAQANASLKRYKAALRRQVDGRTPLLEKTLSSLEACSEALHKDIKSLKSHDDETRWGPPRSPRLHWTYNNSPQSVGHQGTGGIPA